MKSLKMGRVTKRHIDVLQSMLRFYQVQIKVLTRLIPRNKATFHKDFQIARLAYFTAHESAVKAAIRAMGGVA